MIVVADMYELCEQQYVGRQGILVCQCLPRSKVNDAVYECERVDQTCRESTNVKCMIDSGDRNCGYVGADFVKENPSI